MSQFKQIPRFKRKLSNIFICLIFIKLFLMIYIYFFMNSDTLKNLKTDYIDTANVGVNLYPLIQSYERKDWHDYKFMEIESKREGPGENGKGVKFTDENEKKEAKKLFWKEGLNVMASDKISVRRSLPDTRHPLCKDKKYLVNLPQTSVIVIFYNEWPSILKRTIHSIYNRTPHELLKELIIVDDNSTNPELLDAFDLYLKENFDDRVKLVRLVGRKGLIVTRLEGAKYATGEVLLFLDSHMEVSFLSSRYIQNNKKQLNDN